MSQEYKTPRTDAEASDAANYAPIEKGWYVHVDFACQLERELAAVTEERDALIASARIREANSGWRPIETAPMDGTTVIVGRDMGSFGFVRGYGRFEGKPGSFISGWVCNGFTDPPGNLGLGAPTHWMPLPAPPTTEPEQ